MCLVIGYGNTLRGDDGVGRLVAEQLEREHLPAQIIAAHQLLPEFCERISAARQVIFIDAIVGVIGGEITTAPLTAAPEWEAPLAGHHLSPAGLLAAARALYGTCPPALLITVSGVDFGFSSTLSPSVRACLPALVALVKRAIG